MEDIILELGRRLRCAQLMRSQAHRDLCWCNTRRPPAAQTKHQIAALRPDGETQMRPILGPAKVDGSASEPFLRKKIEDLEVIGAANIERAWCGGGFGLDDSICREVERLL